MNAPNGKGANCPRRPTGDRESRDAVARAGPSPFLTKHRLPVPEIRRLLEDNVREDFFSRAEVEALVAALPARFGPS